MQKNKNFLEETEKKYRFLFETMAQGVVYQDFEGKIISANPAAQKILGLSLDEMSGRTSMDPRWKSIHEDGSDFPGETHPAMIALKTGKKIKNTIMGVYDPKLDEHRWININAIPQFKNDEKTPYQVYTTFEDVTDIINTNNALQESEKRYHNLFENMMEGYAYCRMLFDTEKNPVDWIYLDINPAFEQLTGLKDIVGKRVTEAIPGIKELEPELFETYARVSITGQPERFEIYFKPLQLWLNISVYQPEKEHFVAVFEDITERRHAEEQLKSSELKYRKIFENVQDVFFQTDIEGNIRDISPSIERYTGFKRKEFIGKSVLMMYEDMEDSKKLLNLIYSRGEVTDQEIEVKTKSNERVFISINAHVMYDKQKNILGIEGSVRDITDRKIMEIALEKSLQEKEMLLKEIHHRVKNNLMVISSLLNLQSEYIKDKKTRDIFRESQNRAKSMALIHERLYQSTDLKQIDAGDYIRTLASDLFHTYVNGSGHIDLQMDLESVHMDVNTMVPLGLILNELLTNSLKHAFPDDRSGQIKIDLHKKGDEFEFTLSDDGVGFPSVLDFRHSPSLGLQLVNNLVDQIEGQIELDKSEGAAFKIKFKESGY